MCKPTGHCPETRHGPGRARRAREFSQFFVLSAIRGPRAFIYGRRTRYPPPGYVVCADSCVTTDPDPRASNVNPSCAHNTYHNRPKPGSTHTWIAHMDGHSRLTPSLTDTLYSGLISFECSERRRFLSLFLFISLVSSGRCRTSGSGLLLPSLLTYLLAAGGCRLAQIRAPQVKREMGSPPVTLSFIRPSLLAGTSIITACWDDACWSKPLTDWWSKHRLPGHCLHREARVPDVRAGLP